MKAAPYLLLIIAIGIFVFGCSGKTSEQPKTSKTEQKALLENDSILAHKFLQGVQESNKAKMFEAANLTAELVNDSREKLIHATKYKQTEQQRKDAEHALRVSGNIDFIASKIKIILPKSANFQVTKSINSELPDGTKKIEHSVQITYANKAEAISDKEGRSVKSMVLHLLQISRLVNGRWINDISFNTMEFEKMAGKEFEVLSYF